ncbi:MAG TPA: hypothetical protein VFX30_12575 [bacterium]|nr:hypothetical protein [bacterium]
MPETQEPERVWHYYIDSDGHLWHDGAEFDDPATLQMFMKGLADLPPEEAKNGEKWRVFCMGEDCRIAAEDVPYVIQKVTFAPKSVRLTFPGGYEEDLDPSTLFVGAKNVLYCRIRGGKFTARFNRTSYLDLAEHVAFDSKAKGFYLTVDNRRYPIKGVTE